MTDVKFEKTDVTPKAIVRFGVILALVTILVSWGLVYLLRFFRAMEVRSDPPPAPLARSDADQDRRPEPRLQERPFDDIGRLLAEEERTLASYGWVDKDKGVVRIPIKDAMARIAKRGLPARGEPGVTK